MTIRRRLVLAFGAILALFAVTEAFQVWSARLRVRSMDALARALQCQVVMSTFHHRVDDLQKQVSLIGQMDQVAGQDAEARRLSNEELDHALDDLRRLRALSDSRQVARVAELETTYVKLAEAWRQFYNYLGSEQGWSVAYQVRAEPLARQLLVQLLPAIEKEENDLAAAAEADFSTVTRLTQRVNLSIFVLSMLVASIIAYLLSKSITDSLGELKLGASIIGTMNLDHRIAVRSKDEIGVVAHAFNDMAEILAEARQELTLANDALTVRNEEVERQREVSDSLLKNILPGPVADELAARGQVEPRYFEEVTILFTDFVGFTLATEKLPAEELVACLNGYFTDFDRIVTRYGLEKLKTIGDSYMCASGLPLRDPAHPVNAALAAFEMVETVKRRAAQHPDVTWSVRIGMHTGPVVAGVVGIKKFAFDVWGDTVNYASRMESGSAPNRINVSWAAQRRLKDFFSVEHRGKMTTKDKKELDMYFLTGVRSELLDEGMDGKVPTAFRRRYRAYFQRDLEVFPPSFLARTAAHPAAMTGELG